jgi:hypothetical protein
VRKVQKPRAAVTKGLRNRDFKRKILIFCAQNFFQLSSQIKGNLVNCFVSLFEVRHPRCVGSITKNFCVLHIQMKHKYISPSSTVGIKLHVSALYVGHLRV